MVTAAEITDEQTLQAWLATRPREDAVAIAWRAAARVFPLWGHAMEWEWARERDLTALPILRQILTSGFARRYPPPEVRAATRATAAAFAARAASLAADAVAWPAIRTDAADAAARQDLFTRPLWPDTPPGWFTRADAETRTIWEMEPEHWRFWTRWWDSVIAGTPLNPDLLRDIALIPDDIWQQGPGPVAKAIEDIKARYRRTSNEEQAELLLRAALADYSFDAIDRVMRMVPFEEDIRHLRDPAQLGAFLDDAESLRDDIELFFSALSAESQMQGAGFARTYLNGVLDEFSRARPLNHLRVGRVVEMGKILEVYALDPNVAAEFGPAIKALRSHVSSLLDLTRRHFAATLTRMAPLRDISSSPDDDPWDLLQDIQRGIASLGERKASGRPPLSGEDQEVLVSISQSIERLLRQHDVLPMGKSRSSLRREIDNQLALVAVSVALYRESAVKHGAQAAGAVDFVLKQYTRGMGLKELWELIKSGL